MDVSEILSELDRNHTQVPRIALQEAVAHRDELTPRLLAVLEEVANDPGPFLKNPNRNIHVYAMYLLAQFREPRAYPLLVKIFSAPGEAPFELAGDVLVQDLASILASVSDGDPSGMMELVENEKANGYVRDAALDGLVTLVVCGRRTRDEIMAYFQRLFQILQRQPSEVWDGLANACAGLWPREVKEDLVRAYDEGLVDSMCICWEDIEEALDSGPAAALKRARDSRRLIANTADAIGWWSCFHDYHGKAKGAYAGIDEEDDVEGLEDGVAGLSPPLRPDPLIPAPYQRTGPKVGRNERAPAGVGKSTRSAAGAEQSPQVAGGAEKFFPGLWTSVPQR